MYLKSLTLHGFKSFANKTELLFDDGITAVVGPNGSGKSNISDAVRWVLGEQSAKSLRGGKMEDVIFSGTEHRKALGYAEVKLCVSNSDGILSVDYDEVEVSRRIYRSGESEYSLNGTNCRLKDIYELFLDTGVGKDGYSIIGQGKVDAVLSSKTEERRRIFEEASGIMKYKLRKIESERKLESTAQNLLRINDIINELEMHIGPLKEQSEKALKYRQLREELKDLEVGLYMETYKEITHNLAAMEESVNTQTEVYNAEKEKLDRVNETTVANNEKIKKFDEIIEKLRSDFHEAEKRYEHFVSEIKVKQEKLVSCNENIKRLEEEIAENNSRLALSEGDKEKQKERIDYLEARKVEYKNKLEAKESEYEVMLRSLSDKDKEIEALRNIITDKRDILADKRLQAGNIKIHAEGLKKRIDAVTGEVFHLKSDIGKEQIAFESIRDRLEEKVKELNDINGKLQTLNDEIVNLTELGERERYQHSELNKQYQYKLSRLKMLSDMERRIEGYAGSVKMILAGKRDNAPFAEGVEGAFAQLIRVDKEYEKAVEFALGGVLQNIVVEDVNIAKKCIWHLKKNSSGRATFLPVSIIKGAYFDKQTLNRLQGQPGFVGIASDLVETDDKYREIVASFLGKTAVVYSYDDAVNITALFNNKIKVVTLEGEVFYAGGSITGGGKSGKTPGLISGRREIEELTEETTAIRDNLDVMENTIADIESMTIEVKKETEELTREKNQSEIMAAQLKNQSEHIQTINERTEKRVEMLLAEKNQLEKEVEEDERQNDIYLEETKKIEEEIERLRYSIENVRTEYKNDDEAREFFYEDITDLKISLNSVVESLQTARENSEKILETHRYMIERSSQKEGEISEIGKMIITITGEINEFGMLKDEENTVIERLREDIDKAVNERTIPEKAIFESIDSVNEINKVIAAIREDINKLEIRKERLRAESENIHNRLWEDYEITVSKAYEYSWDNRKMSRTSVQKEVNRLKNEIKSLGAVNIAAVEEYQNTLTRKEFMTAQRNDMEEAKTKLLDVIEEMTAVMRKRFIEQFRLINESFNEVFRMMFSGGKAELSLSDTGNVLECGIDINARPPGKRLQNMMLLSGGEKALTAIALLFAILKIRPTPFCILDEIEAALDEANVRRFGDYLKKVAESTQFIVVTHRKGTMEAADTLYGVTMEEHGISKVVSLKI